MAFSSLKDELQNLKSCGGPEFRHDSGSLLKDGCDHARIAAAMQNGDDCERFFIGGVSNHIVADNLKAQGTGCEVWAAMAGRSL